MSPLIDFLESRPSADGAEVVGWRVEVVEGIGLRVGIRDSRLGGPYEGPGAALRLGGEVVIHWSDRRLTRAAIDRRGVLNPAAALSAWRATAFEGRRGRLPPLAGPTALPAVETFDASVGAAVDDSPSRTLELLDRLRAECQRLGARRVDAVLRASRGDRVVATSQRFWTEWRETSVTIDLWVDELAGASYGRRVWPLASDLERLVATTTTLAPQLRQAQALPETARGVLFMPAVVEALLGRLLLSNLSGQAIRDGRSPLTMADLDERRQIIRDDLDLVIDTTRPLDLASAPCSPDGVPAGRVRLIESGRLTSPVLDSETAGDFALPATPAPRGRPTATLESTRHVIDLDSALSLLGDGAIMRDLPGLHTQQPRRGTYALVAPDAQVVQGGVAGGRCAVRLAGRLLDHLTQPSSELVRIPGELGVGLLVLSSVTLMPA